MIFEWVLCVRAIVVVKQENTAEELKKDGISEKSV
jgi:hypothetical protein